MSEWIFKMSGKYVIVSDVLSFLWKSVFSILALIAQDLVRTHLNIYYGACFCGRAFLQK